MTRPAMTPAGRGPATNQRAGRSAPPRGRRRALAQQPAPRAPRRISGPLAGRAAGWVSRGTARADERTPPSPPRRGRTRSGAGALPSLAARAAAFARALPDHALLDRVVRGRVWIPLLGVMLAGIVAMQVEVLKLGASIGRSIERTAALQSRNQLLRASVAELADEQRIERLAAARGMVMPAPNAVGFLSSHQRGNVQQALANIKPPDPIAFSASLSSNGAVVTAAGTSTQAAPTQTASQLQSSAPSQSTQTASGTLSTQSSAPTQTVTPTQGAATVPASPAQAGSSSSGGASPSGG